MEPAGSGVGKLIKGNTSGKRHRMRNYKGFTSQGVTTGVSRGCRYLLLALCLLAALPVWGKGVLVVGDTSRAYFQAFATALAAGMEQDSDGVSVVDTGKAGALAVNAESYRCIVTVGNEAARELSAKTSSVPLLHALVTETSSNEIVQRSNGQTSRAFLLIDQPISRLILLASNSMPERSKLGVIYGPHSRLYRNEVRRQADTAGLRLIEKDISEPGQLSGVMSSFNGSTDMLLILPDPTVVNEGTAKTLILGAYLGNLPLVGYSHALVKAGALMSVYSTPEQLGTQAAELINAGFWGDVGKNNMRIYPRYYQVSVNYQVANALQLELPSEKDLKARIERTEGER